MDAGRVEAVLAECERALAAGGRVDLKAVGFWRALEAVKRHPEWVDRHAERIASIDCAAFARAVPFTFPLWLGVVALALGTAIGVALVAAAFGLPPGSRRAAVALLLGVATLLGSTHGLTHLVVGRAVGIRFTHWFSRFPRGAPQPGFKVDYASYLRAAPEARAWMHASGAIVTKVLPFAALAPAAAISAPWWAFALLGLVGVGQLATDVFLSVRLSDWKRFRREMRVARELVSER